MATAVEAARMAAEALRRGDAAAARAGFEAAAAGGATDASVLLGLAIACDNLGDAQAAEAALDRALEREPQNLRALVLRGDIADQRNDARTASAFYQAALAAANANRQVPPDVVPGLRRAQDALKRYSAHYESHLRQSMQSAGFADAPDAEPTRFGQSLDLMFGKKQIYMQQPKFYYFPGLPQTQFYPRADFPWLDAIEAATDDIRAELRAVMQEDGAFVPYVEADPNRPYHAQGGMLGNPQWSAFYFWKAGVLQEKNAARCPKTMAALEHAPLARVPGRTPTVLFSLLKGKAKIPPHHGFVNIRLICHLPLMVPEGCGFRVGNDTRTWREGKAWVFDDTIEHEAWNKSDQTRVILLFDIWRPELSAHEREAVSALFSAIDAEGRGGEEWHA